MESLKKKNKNLKASMKLNCNFQKSVDLKEGGRGSVRKNPPIFEGEGRNYTIPYLGGQPAV